MSGITGALAETYRLEEDPVRSVHWESAEAQRLRFECLASAFVHGRGEEFSVLDAGCGLGAFLPVLAERFPRARYTGADIVVPFVETCRSRYPAAEFRLADMLSIDGPFDYAVVSGVFNEVPAGVTPEAFTPWIVERLSHLWEISRCGVAVNFIADVGLRWKNPRNYYASPALFLEVAARHSRFFALRHDYPLYEMTLSILRPEVVRARCGGIGDWR